MERMEIDLTLPDYQHNTSSKKAIRYLYRLMRQWDYLETKLATYGKKDPRYPGIKKFQNALGWAIHELRYMYKIRKEGEAHET